MVTTFDTNAIRLCNAVGQSVRDWRGKPTAAAIKDNFMTCSIFRREDLERKARPAGERPNEEKKVS